MFLYVEQFTYKSLLFNINKYLYYSNEQTKSVCNIFTTFR